MIYVLQVLSLSRYLAIGAERPLVVTDAACTSYHTTDRTKTFFEESLAITWQRSSESSASRRIDAACSSGKGGNTFGTADGGCKPTARTRGVDIMTPTQTKKKDKKST